MWKKLDKYSVLTHVYPGCIITTDPDNADRYYYFKEIYLGYVLAISKASNMILKIFREEQLADGEWFVKMQHSR